MAALFDLPPVWMAPMAGEAASAALVAAVSAGGGFGQLGAAYLTPARITEVAAEIRARTDRPFGINLFCPQPWLRDDAALDGYLTRLGAWHHELGLPAPTRPEHFEEDFDAQLEATIAARPAVISFVMGDPGVARVAALKAQGFKIVGTATQVSEGRMLQASGVDAVVASNDGTAGGVVAALTAQGMAGIPVSGQDGDMAALNRVALGTQTVSVWKDSRALGKAAGEIAVALAGGTAMDKIEGSAVFKSPGGKDLNSVLLKPVPITKDNLNVVLDAGWITKDLLCQGGATVDVCK
jgi:nitronate monooxygenase